MGVARLCAYRRQLRMMRQSARRQEECLRSLRFTLTLLASALCAAGVACSADSSQEPDATSTPKPVPSPVVFAQEPALSYTRGDPSFEARPGATAHFGTLGGAVYQIEMPDDWNGRLVLYMHGSRTFEPELTVDMPSIRNHLIRNGFAWGASSYSSNEPSLGPIPIDETAALWDLFARNLGQPKYTYVTGHSLGGIASVLAAEQYADRYDGSLPICGTGYPDTFTDYLVAGAYIAGITQAEFDAMTSEDAYAEIFAALEDDSTYELLRDLVVDLTGGPRPLAATGVDLDINAGDAWETSQLAVDDRLNGNRDIVYELSDATGVSSGEFNAAAVRFDTGPLTGQLNEVLTGDLQIPTLALTMTGEIRVPLDSARSLQRLVDAADKHDLLVQRFVRDPYHCGSTNSEWVQALEDLIDWVENGKKPKGEDALSDPSKLGEDFTLAPRFGLDEADNVPGADKRVIVSGSATLDGEPIKSGLISATVRNEEGLGRRCALAFALIRSGQFELSVAAEEEMHGCGGPGAKVLLVHDPFGDAVFAQHIVAWPSSGRQLTADPVFLSSDTQGPSLPATFVTGEALDANGEYLEPGTVIEAFIGDVLCGTGSLLHIWTTATDPTGYDIAVVNPELKPACRGGETITFQIGGKLVDGAVTHDLGLHNLELVLR